MKTLIHNYILEHKNEIVSELKQLIKIPSAREAAQQDMPFGKNCDAVLQHIRSLFDQNGFDTEYRREEGYLLSYYGNGKKSLGLFSHADVVPVSDDWLFTTPFEPIEKDGFLIGRGAVDDKSAVIISLYCAKIIKELNLPFDSRLVFFIGANEESGMADIQNYVQNNAQPDFALVDDTAFPLYYGNKGMLLLNATGDLPLENIIDVKASNAKGAILGKAEFTLKYSDELYAYLKERESERLTVISDTDAIKLEAVGISRHTALVEGSLNAASLIADVLKDCEFICENDRRQMDFLSRILSDYYGKSIGIDNADPTFGQLTVANDIITLTDNILHLHFNIRFGAEVILPTLKEKLNGIFKENLFSFEIERESAAHCIDIENPYLKKCLETYKTFTHDAFAVPIINAGGTYAKYLDCAVEIGPTLKGGAPHGMPLGHGGAHQPDECISIEGLLEALELTLLMLLECDKI